MIGVQWKVFTLATVLLAVAATIVDSLKTPQSTPLCQPPTTAPHRLEKIIGQCQEEIKYALIQEALNVLRESIGLRANRNTVAHLRSKRQAFSGEERRIAGCLLQCVYRKMKAVDENGFPVATGLVKIYSEGVKDRNYYLATIQAVQQCLSQEIQSRNNDPKIVEAEGYTCDVAYNMFNCVSDQIELLCGTTP
uniref:Putative odorant-binding protein n=1 Tax=Triatoma brasiliensis TaxID=65344 RepID=A0A162X325_TRIBS|nr:putative odorant-binding protein [Triatoma brasiliensis]